MTYQGSKHVVLLRFTCTQGSFVAACELCTDMQRVCSGVLFQYPGFLIASLVGAGAANFLKHPAPWLEGIVAGVHATSCHFIRRLQIRHFWMMRSLLFTLSSKRQNQSLQHSSHADQVPPCTCFGLVLCRSYPWLYESHCGCLPGLAAVGVGAGGKRCAELKSTVA